MLHPRQVLQGAQSGAALLPVCDHYSGTPLRMRKSLDLQAQLSEEFGRCVFDATLDCEDGAPVGAEAEQAHRIAELALEQARLTSEGRRVNRVGARVHPVDHPAFESDVQTIVGRAGTVLDYLMLPKVESLADVEPALTAIDRAGRSARALAGLPALPLHVLIESPGALAQVVAIAAHPRVESLSFGLMDFVSAHGGAIPASAMAYDASGQGGLDQFSHPLVRRAKLEIAAACHAHAKVPSHCVSLNFVMRPRWSGLRNRPRRHWASPACGASTPTRSVPFCGPLRPLRRRLNKPSASSRPRWRRTGRRLRWTVCCTTGPVTGIFGICWSQRTAAACGSPRPCSPF